jgi:DNA integrity scanning protein DisA with diadenylate cyclase activity
MIEVAHRLAKSYEADALLVLIEAPIDWNHLRKAAAPHKLVVAADDASHLDGAKDEGLDVVALDMPQSPVIEKLTQALLESVADELLEPGADVIAVYSGFEAGKVDSVSLIHLDEHLRRLTARDLRQLETRVPLDTLKTVVDLAVDIGREGREGKPVGTMFVVGSAKAVLERCHPVGFDPMKGYKKTERLIQDRRVREGLKEIAQMDGAFVVAADGTVMAAAQFVNAPAEGITMSKGLGTRHWAAAAISRLSNAIAVTVSESNGTVRIFQNGEVILRIEPFRSAMKWKDFEFEPPTTAD